MPRDIKISIPQLVKYWVADTSTKKRTVARQLLEEQGGAPYYREFDSLIQEYVRGRQVDDEIFERKIQELRNRQPEKSQDAHEYARIEHNIRVIQAASAYFPRNFCNNVAFLPQSRSIPRISWEGVNIEISLAPDFVYTYSQRRRNYVGAIKLFYAEVPMSQSNGELIAALIKEFLTRFYSNSGRIRNCDCRLYNLNSCQEYLSPESITKRLQQIEEDCREIYAKIERYIPGE